MSAGGGARRLSGASLWFVLMCVASVFMWLGIPLLWLVVAGQVQAGTGSLGAAVGVALVGAVVTILLAVRVLGWVSHRHALARAARGLDDFGNAPLEGVIVVTAVIALVAFVGWFLFLSGAEPIPLGLPK